MNCAICGNTFKKTGKGNWSNICNKCKKGEQNIKTNKNFCKEIENNETIAKSEIKKMYLELIKNSGFSLVRLSKILGLANTASYYWLKSGALPKHIATIKKLEFIYPKFTKLAKNIFEKSSILHNDGYDIVDIVNSKDHIYRERKSIINIPVKDKFDIKYRKEFAEFLRQKRESNKIALIKIGKVLAYCGFVKNRSAKTGAIQAHHWESGKNFPNNIMKLALLDKIYGGVFNKLFNICPKTSIKLNKQEKQEIVRKIKETEPKKRGRKAKAVA